MKIPDRFPVMVRRGSVTIRIRSESIGGYQFYGIDFHDGRKRCRKRFNTYQDARREADVIAARLASGEAQALHLTGHDRREYVQAMAILRTSGVGLVDAVERFTKAQALLGDVSLVDAAEFYLKRNPKNLVRKTVSEAVAELLQAKTEAGRSRVYVADLRYRCGRFADAFQCALTDVTGDLIESFLGSLKLSARSRNNFVRAIRTLVEFAIKKRYLPKDWEEMESVERHSEGSEKISLFTPGDLRSILSRTRIEMVPFICLGAFAGLRHAELARLDWGDVNLESGYVVVDAAKAKTKARRLVPISANLMAWLLTCPNRNGPVVPFKCIGDQVLSICQGGPGGQPPAIQWKPNGLRHSAISYRCALTGDVARIAAESGNSPAVIHSNYRELATLAQAEEWFAIRPETAG
ncbi:MAG: site-specific integrase [Verrucomicrobia bacterium]|nr:site-specific integrase [Verrucomicrobiota bacterium]